jgi:hypothetical protein
MKKGPIARIPIQMERVDGPAAKEIWESISIAIDDIYNKVCHQLFYNIKLVINSRSSLCLLSFFNGRMCPITNLKSFTGVLTS